MEAESPEPSFLIGEISGNAPQEIPMTEDQALYLQYYIDPMVNKLIADMDLTLKYRRQSDEYQKRTLPEFNSP